MKKALFVLMIVYMVILTACGQTDSSFVGKENKETPRFDLIYKDVRDDYPDYYIIQDNQTGKKYLCVKFASYAGGVTPLLESDKK